MNFNLVKKPKKKDEDNDEILDEDEMDFNDNNNDDDDKSEKELELEAKKRMFRFMGIIIGVVFGLFLLLYLFSLLNGKSYSYEKIETIMENAAKSYFKDYPTSLPVNDGDIVEIDSSNLVAAGKMKDLSYYTKKGVVCSGTVRVEKSGTEYLYLPYLNCGDSYVTVELYRKIQEDNPVVTSGYGLYSYKGGYSFRGETLNNYVQLDNSLWRIVKIDSNNQVMLILDNTLEYSVEWDNRYNDDSSYSSGINEFNTSRIREYLDKIYTNPNKKDNEDILTTHDKARMVAMDLCVGKRDKTDESKDNSVECKTKYKNQKIGLLTLSDYLYASIDPNCKSSTTKSCKNYNYLVSKTDWWLATPSTENSYSVFYVIGGGSVGIDSCGNYSYVRPVILLGSSVKYASGKGTEEEPYTIK